MTVVGNYELIRKTNQTLILNLIKEKGSISRADIAKTLNLSPPSTSYNINNLLSMRLVVEVGEGVSSGGRRPILLELNRGYGYIIIVDLNGEGMKIHLSNICSEIVDTEECSVMEDDPCVAIYMAVIQTTDHLMSRNCINLDDVKLVLITLPGFYDKKEDKFIALSYTKWNDMDIKKLLEDRYNTNVIIKSDVAAAAYGEYKCGLKQRTENMLFLNADSCIEAGIIINGELYEGSLGASGMIGRTGFSRDHIGGLYKGNGYLDSMVSVPRLIQKIRNICRDDVQLLELCGGDTNNLDFRVIKRAYETNHPVIKSELNKVVDLIALCIGNMNSLMDFDTIVLGGRMATLGEYYILSIKRIISEMCCHIPYITFSTLKNNSVSYGAAALGQELLLKEVIN